MSPLKSNKPPSLAIILGSHKPDDEQDGGDEDREQSKTDAAEALIEAIHSKDAQGVVEAMGALHDLCADERDEEEDEEPEEQR